MKQEFYDIAFRKKIYRTLESLQTDVNEWLRQYNEFRPHSGKYCYGKTPMQTFHDAKRIVIEKQIDLLEMRGDNQQKDSTCVVSATKGCSENKDFRGSQDLTVN